MSRALLLGRNVFNLKSALIPLLNGGSFTTIQSRGAAHYWNKDWRPGPYPKTEDEKRAAAKKYGMIREDYEPYPDDGTGYGDYPKLPIISAEARDPHGLYENDDLKRNYGEPMHVDIDMHGEDRYNANQRLVLPLWQIYTVFLTFIGTMVGLFFLGQEYRFCVVKQMPKQMPYSGEDMSKAVRNVHYTFETK